MVTLHGHSFPGQTIAAAPEWARGPNEKVEAGVPREYELGGGLSKFRICPRCRRCEVDAWIESRALW